MITAAVGAACSVVLAPVVISAAGFTTGGIAAGSVASSMMSSAAIANGGGVASGSMVAILQSFGAAGLTKAATAAVVSAGATVGGVAGWVGKMLIR
nr:TPA: putative ISG12(1) protein [Ictalurus punctatus]